ncbi:MAG TPA: hypothetical protein VFJ96_11665 [Gemmatimonadaceae bacterium]|nr:hypothetical protein [Gemmatimonadaceae bacterium]
MMLVGGAVALVVVIGVCRAGPRSEQMREAAAPTIRAIEHYAEQHGRYPASLSIMGAQAPLTAYGRFHYHASPDGSSCSLSAGSRVRDGFVLSWDCATRLWTTNPTMHIGPSTTAQADSAVLSEPEDTSASHEPSV